MKKSKLNDYKKRLLDLRTRSRAELNRTIDVIAEDARPVGEHDRGKSESLDKEIEVERAEEQIHRQINEALARIEAGTYGCCQNCGGTIAAQRLDAIPYTSHCIECERSIEGE